MSAIQCMHSANSDSGTITIGQSPLAAIRVLSDARGLRCTACGGCVVLKAGRVLAPHFAHLPGADCAHPDSEPETEAHRAGKDLLVEWLAAVLPDSTITREASIAKTGQRADVYLESGGLRIAIEFQCADIDGREWLRRHRLYRSAGILDLWFLGAGRLRTVERGLRRSCLESVMARFGAPLLFLDPLGERFSPGAAARLRRSGPRGRKPALSSRQLIELDFPWTLLDWPLQARMAKALAPNRRPGIASQGTETSRAGDRRLLGYLAQRFRVNPESLPLLFGIPIAGDEAIDCSPRFWQAAIYYRFIEGKVGGSVRMRDLETWARRYLPLTGSPPSVLRRVLYGYREILAAAGLLEIGSCPGSCVIIADLVTPGTAPDPGAAQRQAALSRAALWHTP